LKDYITFGFKLLSNVFSLKFFITVIARRYFIVSTRSI